MKFIAIDTECTGGQFRRPLPHFDNPDELFPHKPAPYLVTYCTDDGKSGVLARWKVDPRTRKVHVRDSDLTRIRKIAAKYPKLVFHNAKFDLAALTSIGLDLTELGIPIHDTLAGAHVLDSEEAHGLKSLGVRYLGILDEDEDIVKEQTRRARNRAKELGIPRGPKVATDYFMTREILKDTSDEFYGVRDAVRTAVLHHFQIEQLNRQHLYHHYERERQIMLLTYYQEQLGIRVRPRSLTRKRRSLAASKADHLAFLQKIATPYGLPDLNPNSPKQLNALMHGEEGLALPVLSRTKKNQQPSTDEKTLVQLSAMADDITISKRVRPAWRNLGVAPKFSSRKWADASSFLATLLDYREETSALTYLVSYDKHKVEVPRVGRDREYRIYPSINPWATNTTRYSVSDPNSQNVSKQSKVPLRRAFGPGPGRMWLCYDYNQLELRLMAKASGDPTLNRILANNEDRHQITASALEIPRKQGKNVNFAWQYGAGGNKLSAMAGMDASTFNLLMRQTYPLIVAFMDQTISIVRRRLRQDGRAYVYTLFGYRLTVPVNEPYKGTNYIIQGTAGDILKNALLDLWKYLKATELDDTIFLLMSVHDEIVIDAPKTLSPKYVSTFKSIMEAQGESIKCHLPVNVEYTTTSWQDTKKYPFNKKAK